MAMIVLQAGSGGMVFAIQMVIIVGIFYVMFVLPQRKERKRHAEMLAALKRGDEVVTSGGLVGEILQLNDNLVTLKSGDARVQVERARIARLVTPPAKG